MTRLASSGRATTSTTTTLTKTTRPLAGVQTERLAGTASLTIDVDSLRCYREVHGLPRRDDDGNDPIFTRALPRFLDVMAKLGRRATLFVVGRDLRTPAAAEVIRAAAEAGHEIASHSHAHDYRLSRLPPVRIALDLEAAEEAIWQVTGQRPVGFRAPGYNQSEALFDAIEERGYHYDSSFLPTPAYFAARALAIGLYRVRLRHTRSLVGDPREFSAPRGPFIPAVGARHRPAERGERQRSFLEIPMGVASAARLPWIGTTIALAADVVGTTLTRAALLDEDTPAVLELHAMDFLGDDDDGVEPALRSAQPDLKVPLAAKLRRLERTMARVCAQRDVLPLAELAAQGRPVELPLPHRFATTPPLPATETTRRHAVSESETA
jgi:peptidoglycan/xylan/chitin deacetylase (PgdA/CDA1 family)